MSAEISPEVQDYIKNLNAQLDRERVKNMNVENSLGAAGLSTAGKDQTIVELQLELDETLNQLHHQLSGHEIQINPETNQPVWTEPTDDRLKNFSDYGVKQIMNKLKMYLNINTLMSFYDETTIKWKVKDFGIELSDLFLTRYEHILYYPSPEELFERYKPIVQESNKSKSKELQISDEELYKRCIRWSEEELASRENLLPGICWDLINMVHSAYSRALQGKERKSLGERGINIHQSNTGEGDSILPTNKGGFLKSLRG